MTKQAPGECIGLVGLGLMGRGIATCLLSHGYRVIAYNRTHSRARAARTFIEAQLEDLVRRKMLKRSQMRDWRERFTIVRACRGLAPCSFVIESVKEDLKLKARLFDEVEEHVAPGTVIASNTSSFPITLLQTKRKHPERFVVMHWSEPAWITRFMEIVRSETTTDETVRRAQAVGVRCGKQPGILNFDIRGFITNRLMYAFIREACYLVDIGVADVATIDRSFRNDTGWWSTLAGPFRWMDLTGIEAYGLAMQDLNAELCNQKTVAKCMRKMMRKHARGTADQQGFYSYTKQGAKAWDEAWIDFTFDIRKLVDKYETRLRKADALGEEDVR